MDFKWYLTIDIKTEEPDWEDSDKCDALFEDALAKFYNAQEAFFQYLDSNDIEYEVLNDESK